MAIQWYTVQRWNLLTAPKHNGEDRPQTNYAEWQKPNKQTKKRVQMEWSYLRKILENATTLAVTERSRIAGLVATVSGERREEAEIIREQEEIRGAVNMLVILTGAMDAWV